METWKNTEIAKFHKYAHSGDKQTHIKYMLNVYIHMRCTEININSNGMLVCSNNPKDGLTRKTLC